MIPIGDENPTERWPYVNWSLIGLNVLAFLLTAGSLEAVIKDYAFVPARPQPVDVITSMFLHGGFGHLLGNMLFLWIFGDNVEDKLGRVWYPVFYIGCGVAAAVAHFAMHHGSSVPVVGASGAVAGVLGMYAVLFPNHQIKIFYFFAWFWWGTFFISAKWALGIWFAGQALMTALLERAGVGGVAYLAHIGGFVVGAGLGFLLKERLLAGAPPPRARPRVTPLWGRGRPPLPDALDERGAPVYSREAPARVVEAPPPPRPAGWRRGGAGAWAVLASSDEAADPAAAGRVLAEATGRPPDDVARDLGEARGFLGRGLAEADARERVRALAKAGIAATARDEATLRELPSLAEASRVLLLAHGVQAETNLGFLECSYGEIVLLAAGLARRAGAEEFGDEGSYALVLTAFLLDGPRLLFVEDETVGKLVREGWGVAQGLNLRALAVALVNRAPVADRNRGVEILLGSQRHLDWTGLTFDGFSSYEGYTAWLWQVRGR
ncbi:MAG: rhomboid family intramembrane serine protease [Planctomycetales bacterium]|nr:rhomboid family intramembrane serine protease [Planctomycetales bacterium]